MTWFKVDDSFHSHPKVLACSLDALGLWVKAGAWSSANLSDGFVPDYVARWLAQDDGETATQLVTVGLWKRAKRGYLFRDWQDYNPTRDAVESRRQSDRKRQRQFRKRTGHRENGHAVTTPLLTGESPVSPSSVTAPPSRPVPDSPSGESARPPATCSAHRFVADPPPCGDCRDARQARERFELDERSRLASELDTARRDPRLRCEHGTDGGLHVRSDTGTSPCALCRQQPAPTTME